LAEPQPVDLHFQRFGAGRPVVILHGLFGSARNWQSVARNLADQYSVVTVDLRNHGSSPHAAQMDYAAMSLDVSVLLQKLALKNITLIGHSMGGKAAMTLALSDADRIAQLIIIDIGPGAYVNDYDHLLAAMSQLDLHTISRRADAQARLQSAISDNDIRAFTLQNLIITANSPPHWRINLPAIRNAIEDIVGAIPIGSGAPFNAPSHFIRGENSDRISRDNLASIRDHFPSFKLTTITNSGHWPHAENSVEFITKLRQLLEPDHLTA